MDKSELLALEQLSQLSTEELRVENPELFSEVEATAISQLEASLDAQFSDAPQELREHMETLDLSSVTGEGQDVAQALLDSLQTADLSPELVEEARRRILALQGANILVDPLDPSVPLKDLPLVRGELQQARMYLLGGIVGLDEAKVETMLAEGHSATTLNDAALQSLVNDRVLSEREAAQLGMSVSLYHLFDEDVGLTETVKERRFSKLGGRQVQTIRDLVLLDTDDWLRALRDVETDPPEEMDRETYAELLSKKAATLYPSDAFLARTIRTAPEPQTIVTGLERVQPLFEQNDSLFAARDFDRVNTEGLEDDQIQELRPAYTQLKRFANAYPGMRVAELLDDSRLSPEEKAERVTERIRLLDTVREQNPEVEFLALDYTPESADIAALDLSGLQLEEQRMVLSNFKAYQRTYGVTRDVEDANLVLEAGYNSAVGIAKEIFESFVEHTGLEEVKAREYYDIAKAKAGAVTTAFGTVLDTFQGGFDSLEVANTGPTIEDHLKKLDGFEELFGSQSYCQCEHCQSILGPAAYFVDLMCFIEEHILSRYFAGAKENHVLNLKVRRPDLWTLPLTCKNTNETMPTLDIINEILENYIAKRQGFAGALSDRAAVETAVYKQALSTSVDSFQQPFVLPLERLQTYLAHFDRTRATVARTLGAPPAVVAAGALEVSKLEYELITQSNTTVAFLQKLYGVLLQFQANTGTVTAFDAQTLLGPMGLTRAELGELIGTRFLSTAGGQPVQIKAEKTDSDSIQNDIERIYNLSATSLDRMHRFTRLWRRLSWSMAELDLVWSHLGDADLTSGAVERLVTVLTIQERLGVSVEEACALWSDVPSRPISANGQSLFDRLFNLPPFVLLDGSFPKDTTKFIHPSFRQAGSTAPADNALHRLLAGLRISDEELNLLITHLSAPLGLNLASTNENDKGFDLTVANLSLMYRHAQLAELLDLSIPDLFQLIDHADGIPAGRVENLAHLSTLLEFYDWWKTTDYTLDDLGFITGGKVRRPAAYPDEQAIVNQMLDEVEAERTLVFADTVFAFLEGVTEQHSRDIIAANPTSIEATSDGTGYRLRSDFDPAASLTLPTGVTVTEVAIKDVLLKHHASEVVPTRLSSKLNISVEKIKSLIAMTGVNLADPAFGLALQGGGPSDDLVELVGELLALSVLFRNEVFDADALAFVHAHGSVFAVSDFANVSMESVRKLSIYTSFADTSEESRFSDVEPDVEPAQVRNVLLSFEPTQKFIGADQGDLARVLRVETGLSATLQANVALPNTAPEALQKLSRCVELARHLGTGGEALQLIVSEDYTELAQASDAVLGAFRAKYDAEKEWREKIEPFEDRIRSRKRDALTNHLTHSVHPEFGSSSELYQHFLIDVELEGCARTSRVVAATSSAQLYVHRCLMNLEQDNRVHSDPDRVYVEPTSIPAGEWAWRKNYRVWEANRKVFLYPENYIEPELRDDKSPLFEDLEATLLQQEINEQNVLDAYATYMNGFEEVARLKIAGSYHDKDPASKTDVLHLFGVTPGEPPTYYYRTVQNAHYGETEPDRGVVWSPWRKVDVQIPVRKVAPVVYQGRLYMFWVEITTMPKNEITGGASKFIGYEHKTALRYTALRLDGTWSSPQRISLFHSSFRGDGVIDDPLEEPGENEARRLIPRYDTDQHSEPKDGYTLTGFRWDQVYPELFTSYPRDLTLRGNDLNFRRSIDFYERQLENPNSLPIYDKLNRKLYSRPEFDPVSESDLRLLFYMLPSDANWKSHASYGLASARLERRRLQAQPWWVMADEDNEDKIASYEARINPVPILRLNDADELALINGSLEDCIIDSKGDLLLLQGTVRSAPKYLLKRLATTISGAVSRRLFTGGVDGLLETQAQESLAEAKLPITLLNHVEDASKASKLDFTGPYGVYYREIFFQIPFLIANHLNSQQRFASAQRWYHYLFNPTASETIDLPAGLSEEERARRERDRNWRYREFRNLDLPKLRELLTDKHAIEVYKKDPFNPHAIARLRLSAYQKSIVMKYIDNLLDWGDNLFAQFTMESVNEATLLYVMAADILGKRPAKLGECGEGAITPKTYEKIAALVKEGSEFLVELETYTWSKVGQILANKMKHAYLYAIEPTIIASAASLTVSPETSVMTNGADGYGTFKGYDWKETRTGSWVSKKSGSWSKADVFRVMDHDTPLLKNGGNFPDFGWSLVRQVSPVFCVPANKELREYWDRVEDRLYKIRNCMDIAGVRRQLALFAPEIDPRLLVRARAAGLSIEDVLNATSGNLPPYRFTYLIEKAKSYASAVQGFGAALLSALEKKDVEELNRLRTVHQQNLLKLSTQMREQEIDAASEAELALQRQQDTVTYRKDYYKGLIGPPDRTPAEQRQSRARNTASNLQQQAAELDILAAILHLLPQIGAPTAMKFGGLELGKSSGSYSGVLRDIASYHEAAAASAGLEAGFERRKQGWEHQVALADHELKQIEKQLEAAKIRKQIAERSLEIHQKTIEQLEEVYGFYGDKFSNLGLYTWLSTTLQRLYREAYNSAYAMARLAEQAFRFERGDDGAELLGDGYWDASKTGLLAGERLLIDLQNLERRFIETNYRALEIDQSFSLTQLDPAALIQLREKGSCEFEVPEVFFDLFYPGQYRRKIKSVRLTIPSITGPYTNVSATLTLLESKLRNEPKLGAAYLVDVPRRRSVSIATSTAQNDAGVFELNFRDERYMPFEGAGAVGSKWRLSLPKNFRQFDYQTINDVILHISYTAEEDGVFRDEVEKVNVVVEDSLLDYLKNRPLARLFSLRQDFSGAFNRLLRNPKDTPVKIELTDQHLPIFLRGWNIAVSNARLVLRTADGQAVNNVAISVNGNAQVGFAADPKLGDLWSKDLQNLNTVFPNGIVGEHEFMVKNAGALAPAAATPGDTSAVDPEKLADIMLYLEYKVSGRL